MTTAKTKAKPKATKAPVPVPEPEATQVASNDTMTVAQALAGETPAERKVRLVMESMALMGPDLSAYMRREGLAKKDMTRLRDEVKNAALAGLAQPKAAKGKPSDEQARIKTLENTLKRKEAALAETVALLVLRKKAVALWGEEGAAKSSKSAAVP
jgi:hypothetical protein